MLSKYDSFIQFIYQKNHMYYGIKQVKEFKNKDSKLYKLVDECINDILNDPIDHEIMFEKIFVIAIITMILLLMVYL